MKKLFLITSFLILSCTSKQKPGSDITFYNESGSDIFVIDKYKFNSLDNKKPLDFFTYYYYNYNKKTKRIEAYLSEYYITRYTNKSVFFSIEDYENNLKFGSLTFYIIKKENLYKNKQEILRNNLYDSINIDLKNFHQEGSDNHLYIDENKSKFKSY